MSQKFTLRGTLTAEGMKVAVEMADKFSVGIIESSCNYGEIEGDVHWFDLNTIDPGCENEVKYAEARNLLRHHPTRPNLVQINEELL